MINDIQRYALTLDLHENASGKWVRYEDHRDVLAASRGDDMVLAEAANRVHDFLMSATAYPFSNKISIDPRILFSLILDDTDSQAPYIESAIRDVHEATDATGGRGSITIKYRKKPVAGEAIKANLQSIRSGDLIEWLVSNQVSYEIVTSHADNQLGHDNWFINIHTLEGVMKCSPGDWIIRGVKGEFYPCKPDIFEATYEPVE